MARRRFSAATLLVALSLAAAACSGSPGARRSTTTTTTRPASSSTTAPPRPAPPAGSALPGGFEPASVSFVSSATGFVIGVDSSCPARSCVALARTTDGGSSWVALPAPPAGYVARGGQASAGVPAVSEVRFADELDGWLYGPALFATHDGGASWQQVPVAGSVESLEASGGYVDAVVSPCASQQSCTGSMRVEQAPSGGGSFTTVLSGAPVGAYASDALDLSLHAPVGFAALSPPARPGAALYATGDLAVASRWKPFPDPCSAAPSGFYLVSFVAPDTTSLYTLCSGQGGAGSETKVVVKTTGGKSAVAGQAPRGGDTEALAVSPSGTMVVAAASGASWLYRSTDGGASWSTAATYDDGGLGFNDLGFTTSEQGVVVHGVPGPPGNFSTQLLMTRDGGASWSVVPIS